MITAAVCRALTGEDAVEVRDWERSPLGRETVRIAVRAASVNFPDVLLVRGQYQTRIEPPFVAGTECSGVITETGPDVTGLAVGDRVLGMIGTGAFATEVVCNPSRTQLHRMPDEMPFDEAAALTITYGTAIQGLLRRGGLRAGESVLVLGASGGCGSAAVQIAKAVGATVIAVAGGADKCELVRGIGADVVLDHHNLPSLSAAVKEHTAGQGVDVVFDTVGGPDAREPLRCLAWNGRYLVIGFASGDIPTMSLNQAILKCISVVGVAYGLSALRDPAANAEDFEQLFSWYRKGLIRPVIGHRFPLAETIKALRVVYERRAFGKVVVEMPRAEAGT
ncbi:NADPH:quinone oxidoreductase family protein [Frankia sp. CNm7]|uniref:NADPH:quinone oxidoreductase family protein n=1 Tax=Frankia nepalensis TaxID=1836974 RepID=A0A937RML6_9ACTN|nr:NADPH:quinone oxidoreductase family protein [Frankia nepalensis]MBL7500213.1 NADPH:quinone oxidoreductase family protein [Frankia nepalensis]MBL7514612.1 NADPH:quinone oxidoreductase family protein [Frankia nepalensis]MBL7524302.1 NADPH:quinone oxidoreductase family protein [Frankia nepalensis]MBL7631675.1 NADPH:quinone oxidoreductase family protein [Frankia nepalensis]